MLPPPSEISNFIAAIPVPSPPFFENKGGSTIGTLGIGRKILESVNLFNKNRKDSPIKRERERVHFATSIINE